MCWLGDFFKQREMVMATITYIKPSGTEIQASNNKETKALAKQLGWKKKKVEKQVEPIPQLEIGGENA